MKQKSDSLTDLNLCPKATSCFTRQKNTKLYDH
jgi:hypothetical protein